MGEAHCIAEESSTSASTRTMDGKLDHSLKEDLYLEPGRIDTKVQEIEERLTNLEMQHQTEEKFPVDKSIVVINMREEKEEDREKCTELIQTGIQTGIGLREPCTRMTSRDGKPGLIKVQLGSQQDRINASRHKNELNKTTPYKRVYIRSAQTHQ